MEKDILEAFIGKYVTIVTSEGRRLYGSLVKVTPITAVLYNTRFGNTAVKNTYITAIRLEQNHPPDEDSTPTAQVIF